MSRRSVTGFLTSLLLSTALPLTVAQLAGGEDGQRPRDGLTEPVHRVAKRIEIGDPAKAEHPLDPALQIAKEGLDNLRANVKDYSCTLVKQERITGVLNDPEYIYSEIRNRQTQSRTRLTFDLK